MALVLAPTRELAQQIDKEVNAFAHSSREVRTCIVVGGVQMSEQRHELRAGVEIVVATPGRFIDHLQQGNTNLGRVSYVVLDEADRMLDMGFEPQIREVLQVRSCGGWRAPQPVGFCLSAHVGMWRRGRSRRRGGTGWAGRG
jgi:ATP-dependent RNA helicase DDX5/DBP2